MKELLLESQIILSTELLNLFVAGEELKLAVPLPSGRSLLACDLQVGQLNLQIHDQIPIFVKFIVKLPPVVPRLLLCVSECLLDELLAVAKVGELDHPVSLNGEKGLLEGVDLKHESALLLLNEAAIGLPFLLELCDVL